MNIVSDAFKIIASKPLFIYDKPSKIINKKA